MIQPLIKTERLLLRPFHPNDASALQKICNDPIIARNTLRIPEPYTLDDARKFLLTIEESRLNGKFSAFAITLKSSSELIGAIGLTFDIENNRAEIGYYVGEVWRGNGFATEAVKAVLKYSFEYRKVNRVFAYVFTYNPASAVVLEKAGMKREGLLKGNRLKNEQYQDEWIYGMTRPE